MRSSRHRIRGPLRLTLACTLGAAVTACAEGADVVPGLDKDVAASEAARMPVIVAAQTLPDDDGAPLLISGETDRVAMTVYPNNLALVTETRTVDVPAGASTIRFDGVSDLIIPQSLVLREFTGVSLERNFDYDLLGRASLYEGAVGETVILTRIREGSGRMEGRKMTIISADPDNGVVVRGEDGGVEALMCSAAQERVSFDGLPPGLKARPAMTIEIEAETAGPQTFVVSYLTQGVEWEADYRLDLAETTAIDDDHRLQGWLTVANNTSKSYRDIDLSVIAGTVNRLDDTEPVEPPSDNLRAACWPKGSSKNGRPPPVYASLSNFAPEAMMMRSMADGEFEDEIVVTGSRVQRAPEDVGDYKLYRIERPVTVAAMQTKQLSFVGDARTDVELLFDFDFYELVDTGRGLSTTGYMDASVRYDVLNDRDGRLARALPRGTVNVFAPSTGDGRVLFVGMDGVQDTPIDKDLKLIVGEAVNVDARTVQLPDRPNWARRLPDIRLDENEKWRYKTVTLTNARPDASNVIITDRDYQDTEIIGAERVADEDMPTWRVTIPAAAPDPDYPDDLDDLEDGTVVLRIRHRDPY